ncbi:MAG: 3-dehydroquinate synthase [Candidatus Omnitrophota bacterium]
MKTIRVFLKDNPYSIFIGHGLAQRLSAYSKELALGNMAVVVTSRRIYSIYKKLIEKSLKNIPHTVVLLPDGEHAKSITCLLKIIKTLVRVDGWDKKMFIVSLGGGTVGDVAGFAAAIYKRGTAYLQVPTTLLGQIDAGIGGKTAVDLPQAKNILGAFYQPRAVIIDPLFLESLTAQEIKEGIAEAIKYAVIKDNGFFNFLKKNHLRILQLHAPSLLRLISTCALIKAKVVEEDEKEKKGIRTILNFGHTLAHALEATCGYRLSHGEAVSIGMVYAAELSYALGKCSLGEVQRIRHLVQLFGLPESMAANQAKLCHAIRYDKKFVSGKIRMVLMKKIGKVEICEGIPPELIVETLKKFNS